MSAYRTRTLPVRPRVLLAIAISVVLIASCGPSGPLPNVVLISIDTLRADHVGTYGYTRDTTPNLDELAAAGVVFLNNYSQAPYTAPSQTSLLTSLYASVHGVWAHGEVLDAEIPLLAEIFRDAGYATAAFTQLPGESYPRGFETYERLRPTGRPRNVQRNLDNITGWLESRDERPFFLFVHSFQVHLPYAPAAGFIDRFEHEYYGPLADLLTLQEVEAINSGEMEISAADLQHIITLYDAEVASLDDTLGRVFDFLRDNDLMEATVIAVVSDHGEEFGEHGRVAWHSHTLYNELIKTPLIIAGPGVPEGLRVADHTRNIDVAPTLLELAGVTVPEHFQGFDLAPLWHGEETQSRVVLSELPSRRVSSLTDLSTTRVAGCSICATIRSSNMTSALRWANAWPSSWESPKDGTRSLPARSNSLADLPKFA